MDTYREHLPQLSDAPFVTDGGLETTLIFHHGIDLPEYAAFDALNRPGGYETIRDYFRPYLDIAQRHDAGVVLESCTWRASRDWGRKLGYTPADLRDANRQAIAMLQDIRAGYRGRRPVVISGCIGPRGDGYQASRQTSAETSRAYHQEQIDTLAQTAADLVSAFTITTAAEAIGITQAAQAAGIPVVIGFTVETDGRLPSGEPLGDAITQVDQATTAAPAYYMINCAHPSHVAAALTPGAPWLHRIRSVRANASEKSHAELDGSDTLDQGDPASLGAWTARLAGHLPNFNVIGGCCGTDHRHVAAMCAALDRH